MRTPASRSESRIHFVRTPGIIVVKQRRPEQGKKQKSEAIFSPAAGEWEPRWKRIRETSAAALADFRMSGAAGTQEAPAGIGRNVFRVHYARAAPAAKP